LRGRGFPGTPNGDQIVSIKLVAPAAGTPAAKAAYERMKKEFNFDPRPAGLKIHAMGAYSLHVNGKIQRVEADPEMPLLWVLRDLLDLKGTKFGCGQSSCGACTVHSNGRAIRSCVTPISAVGAAEITTIEAVASTKTGRAVLSSALAAHDLTGLTVAACTTSTASHACPHRPAGFGRRDRLDRGDLGGGRLRRSALRRIGWPCRSSAPCRRRRSSGRSRTWCLSKSSKSRSTQSSGISGSASTR